MDLKAIATKIISKLPEAPIGAPLGQYAWASYREGVPEEPDNELERQLFTDLKGHFANKRIGLPITTVALLQMFIMAGWYKPVLHAPPLETLYRGIKLRGAESAAAFIGIDMENFTEQGTLDMKPRAVPVMNGHSTSWSARKHITRDFSERGVRGYAITLHAKTSNNLMGFLAGPGGLYDVEGMSMYHLEKETVGLEPILIHRIEWVRL